VERSQKILPSREIYPNNNNHSTEVKILNFKTLPTPFFFISFPKGLLSLGYKVYILISWPDIHPLNLYYRPSLTMNRELFPREIQTAPMKMSGDTNYSSKTFFTYGYFSLFYLFLCCLFYLFIYFLFLSYSGVCHLSYISMLFAFLGYFFDGLAFLLRPSLDHDPPYLYDLTQS
jgi:hypothetical protein